MRSLSLAVAAALGLMPALATAQSDAPNLSANTGGMGIGPAPSAVQNRQGPTATGTAQTGGTNGLAFPEGNNSQATGLATGSNNMTSAPIANGALLPKDAPK